MPRSLFGSERDPLASPVGGPERARLGPLLEGGLVVGEVAEHRLRMFAEPGEPAVSAADRVTRGISAQMHHRIVTEGDDVAEAAGLAAEEIERALADARE